MQSFQATEKKGMFEKVQHAMNHFYFGLGHLSRGAVFASYALEYYE
jgi:hypothetical protein